MLAYFMSVRRSRWVSGAPARARDRRPVVALLLVGVLAACSGGSSQPDATPTAAPPAPTGPTSSAARPSTGAVAAPADWPTYHHDNARTGVAPGLAPLGTLRPAWTTELDGAVYGQPLVVGDRLLAGTENDTVYALDSATGRVLWARHVGTPVRRSDLPCGNIDPLGITSTMVYDPASRHVFALAEMDGARHVLVEVDVATGALVSSRPAEPPRGDRVAHQQRGALTLLDGWVYIPYGGLAGDCGQYIGSVVALPTTGTAAARSYAIPTTREAGIWTPGGGVVHAGRLLYASGNGESTSDYDGSDSVLALSPTLQLVDRFTAPEWVDDNRTDLDLGSMSPAVVGSFVYIQGKRGIGYVLRADHLGGIGGQVATLRACASFGGSAVSGDTVYVPCRGRMRAVRIDATGQPSQRWEAAVSASGSPVLGGGAVFVVDYDGGMLYALDSDSGAVRQQVSIGRAPHFASPTLSGSRAYVGTMAGVVAVDGA
ncbi:MAG TPA: PQQ-binding-like beta-propeller repeat protein [Mycobacteriales bacterium]|nr:PQQ-binding-like beta-propeller repeat protein [Mycobacteriales bacterium]